MKKTVWIMAFLVISWTMIAVSIGEEIDYQWAYQGNVAFFEKNEKIGLINGEGYILHHAEFDSVTPFGNNCLAKITIDGKIGMINTSGQIVIEPIACSYMGYMTVENGFTELRDEAVMYQDMQHQWGFYSLEGDLIPKAQWDDTYGFVNGFAYVKKNGLWNILDKQGRLILENWWDSIDIGSKGAATLWSSEEGIDVDSQGQIYATYEIDADGNWHQLTYGTQSIGPYEQMYDLKEQLCAYRLNDLYGIMNSNGAIVTEPLWEYISTFAPDGLLSVYKNSLWGWVDREGNCILDLQWKAIYQVKENRWIGQYENGESWIFNDQGQMICMIGNNLVYTAPYEDGYIEYTTNDGYWGFLDSDGNLLSKVDENEIKQVSLADYSEGWIQVELNDQQLAIMYIDGTIMSSEKWTAISPFYNGYAVVRIGGNEGYIDEFGNLIHPAIWKDCGAYSFVNGQLIAPVTSYSSEQRSYIDENGRTICGVKVR